jgi:hypothetical protein
MVFVDLLAGDGKSASLTISHPSRLFIIEGIFTMCLAPIIFFLMPDSPEKAKWLSAEEKEFVYSVRASSGGGHLEMGDFKWRHIKDAVTGRCAQIVPHSRYPGVVSSLVVLVILTRLKYSFMLEHCRHWVGQMHRYAHLQFLVRLAYYFGAARIHRCKCATNDRSYLCW